MTTTPAKPGRYPAFALAEPETPLVEPGKDHAAARTEGSPQAPDENAERHDHAKP